MAFYAGEHSRVNEENKLVEPDTPLTKMGKTPPPPPAC